MEIINYSPVGLYTRMDAQPFRAPYAQSWEGLLYVRPCFTNFIFTLVDSSTASGNTLSFVSAKLYTCNDSLKATYTTSMQNAFSFDDSGRSYIQVAFNQFNSDQTLPSGTYYFKFTFSVTISGNDIPIDIYTDLFQVLDYSDLSTYNGFLAMQGSSTERVVLPGDYIEFGAQAHGITFFEYIFKTNISKPEYSFEEEIAQRLGYQFIETQVSKKIFNFTALGTEPMCDSLRLFKLLPNKEIYSGIEFNSDGSSLGYCRKYIPIVFNMSVEWQEQGDVAAINCDFEVDTIINNLNIHNI